MATPEQASSTKSENLYRVVPFERAVQIFTQRKLYFASPTAWPDPYEVALEHARSACLFAQCWSSKSMSDAMWRIYSPNCLGVRIGTTRVRMSTALKAALDEDLIGNFAVHDVRYESSGKVQTNLRNLSKILGEAPLFKFAVAGLCIKRDAFEHEKEVRVVISKDSWAKEPAALGRTITVDPSKLIKSVLVDPRAPEEYLVAYEHYFRDVLGFKGSFGRSGLYATPAHFVAKEDEEVEDES
jgi:hypothetical protein